MKKRCGESTSLLVVLPAPPSYHTTCHFPRTRKEDIQAPPPLLQGDNTDSMLGLVDYSSGEEETIGTSCLPPSLPSPSFPHPYVHPSLPPPSSTASAKKLDEKKIEAKEAADAALAAAASSSSSSDDDDDDDEDGEEERGGKRVSSSSSRPHGNDSKKPKLLPSALDLLATTEAPAFLSVPAPLPEFDVQPVVDTR